MKKIYVVLTFTLLAFSAAFSQTNTTYPGNGEMGFGDQIGTGNLVINYDGSNLTFTLHGGGGTFNNALVLYIDNGQGGGFDSTGLFNDVSSGLAVAISGYTATGDGGGPARANLTFPSGFTPQYALAFGVESDGFTPPAELVKLVNDGTFTVISTPSLNTSGTDTFSVAITPAELGLTGSSFGFNFIGTLISNTGYRANEAIGINFPAGYGNVAWGEYADTSAPLLFATGSFAVSFGAFNGVLKGESTDLTWSTKNEVNTKEFNVQKSTDGVTWNTIGTVSSKNSADGAEYGFVDNNVTASKNFYRLQIINDDGTFTYTSVIIINKNGGHSVIVLGNPVTNTINLNISDEGAENYQLSLFSSDGKLIATQPFNQTGGTSRVAMNVPSGATGVLVLKVTNGTNTDVFRVLAQ